MLVDSKGNAKIADLGLSADFSASPKRLHKAATTLAYRAPEQIFGLKEGYGLEADIWSLGCILAELLICQPLFVEAKNYKHYVALLVERLGESSFEGWEEAQEHEDFKGGLRGASRKPSANIKSYLVGKGLKDPLALDLLSQLLTAKPEKRISLRDVLRHPYLTATHQDELDDFPVLGLDCHEFTVRKLFYRKRKQRLARQLKSDVGVLEKGKEGIRELCRKREVLEKREYSTGDELKRLKFN